MCDDGGDEDEHDGDDNVEDGGQHEGGDQATGEARDDDDDGGDVDVDCGVFVCLSRNGCHQRRLIDLKRIRSIQWLATSTRFLVLLLSSSSS